MDLRNLILLAVSLVLGIWLLFLILRRGAKRHFPVFFGYVLCTVGVTAGRLLTVAHYRTYFFVFWWTEALFLLLGLLALHEVFQWGYAGFFRFYWFRFLYFGAIALVLLIAIRNAVVNPPVQAHPIIALILDFGIAVNLIQACIAALFGLLARPLGIRFRRYPFGIAAGFAASSIGPFLGYLLRSIFGTKLESFAGYCSAVAYILGLLIWVAAFSRKDPSEKAWTPPMEPDEMLQVLRGYLRALGHGKEKQ